MRGRILLSALVAGSCAGASLQPTVTDRRGFDPIRMAMYSVEFEVSCDSCRVRFGVEGSTRTDVVEGGWKRSVPLGTLRDGDLVRVFLDLTPFGDATVVMAAIEMEGRTIRSGKGDKPGKPVSLRARVGPRGGEPST